MMLLKPAFIRRVTVKAGAGLGMAVGKVPSGHTKPYPYPLEKNLLIPTTHHHGYKIMSYPYPPWVAGTHRVPISINITIDRHDHLDHKNKYQHNKCFEPNIILSQVQQYSTLNGNILPSSHTKHTIDSTKLWTYHILNRIYQKSTENKFILYETYKSGLTCHILAGSPSGSGYRATENIPTLTVPDGHNK
jgi:hypothetical protein